MIKQLTIFGTLLFGANVSASDLYVEHPTDFRLNLARHTLALSDGSTTFDTTVEQLGIAWRERYGQRLQFGLLGGYTYVTQTNNPATAGLDPNGYHAGLTLDIDVWTTDRLRLAVGTAYLYQRVKHEETEQTVELAWYEPSAYVSVTAELSSNLRAYGGTRYGVVDGEQRLHGTQNETRTLKRSATAGALVGLELQLEENGYVGVVGETGYHRGAALYFGRRFMF
ncbi:MAG: hypothetical protein HY308_13875 [Gammaproteobacteria bacterium]|nr:hypothetical protein [Gammaproteobacteria bacterium]